jgi:uncharacterized protein YndB with AHSA1/START domain
MWTALIAIACVAGLVVAVLVGLYAAGRSGNGTIHETSIEIAAPCDQVWPWLVDSERVKQWVGGLKVIESLTPDKGLEVGARDRLEVEVNGQLFEIFSEVTLVDPGRLVEQRLSQEGALAWHEVARFSISSLGNDRALFTVTASYTYTTIAGIVMEPIIRVAARKKLAKDLEALKTLVERATR